MIAWLQKHFLAKTTVRVLLEAGLGLTAALWLAVRVTPEIPATNVFGTIFFLPQFALVWAAIRLRLRPQFNRATLYNEIAVGLVLRILSAGLGWIFASAYDAAPFIQFENWPHPIPLFVFSATFLPWMIYRLGLFGLRRWLQFSRKSFLWMLVNAQMTSTMLLIIVGSLFTWLPALWDRYPGEQPSSVLAGIVLEVVRSFIPRLGVSIVFLTVLVAVSFPAVLLVSYLTARRFVGRVQTLAGAMHQARKGDLGIRIEPCGEDEIAQLQDDFNHMAADLQTERSRVADLLNNQRELAAVISHELRTPITVMRASLENHLGHDDTAQNQRDLSLLHQQTLSLQALVEDLFVLSQLDTRRLQMECRWVEPGGLLADTTSALAEVAWQSKQIELSSLPAENLPRVWTDPLRLEQVLKNLIQNAIRHTPTGGVIQVTAEQDSPGYVLIEVKDSGEGITAEDLPYIWERYYRGGKNKTGRTGIGLALVKELVEAMGGAVGVDSGPQEGSRIRVRLRSEI